MAGSPVADVLTRNWASPFRPPRRRPRARPSGENAERHHSVGYHAIGRDPAGPRPGCGCAADAEAVARATERAHHHRRPPRRTPSSGARRPTSSPRAPGLRTRPRLPAPGRPHHTTCRTARVAGAPNRRTPRQCSRGCSRPSRDDTMRLARVRRSRSRQFDPPGPTASSRWPVSSPVLDWPPPRCASPRNPDGTVLVEIIDFGLDPRRVQMPPFGRRV